MHDTGIFADRPPLSDEELFAVVRGEPCPSCRDLGPTKALGILFDRYHARVLHSCERILGERGLAEDCLHDIFISLLDPARKYQNRGNFGAWLFVTTRNHCLNALKRHRREIDMDPYEEFVNRPSAQAGPATEFENREIGERIRAACDTELNETEQRVIDLRLKWGLSIKAIDSILELTNVSGSRTHLSTATRKLRRALADIAPSPRRKEGTNER